MALNFTPQSEEQITAERAKFGNLTPGTYPATVAESAEKISGPQSKVPGTPMIHLKLHVHRPDGSGVKFVDDYLHPSLPWKVRHFCAQANLLSLYNTGALSAEDCAGKQVYVIIGVEKGRAKDDGSGESYPDKHIVKDYAPPAGSAAASGNQPAFAPTRPQPTEEQLANQTPAKAGKDEDVPF